MMLYAPCPHQVLPCTLCGGTGFTPAGLTTLDVRALRDRVDGLEALLIWTVAQDGCDSDERRAVARWLGLGLEELDTRCRRVGGEARTA